jgi:hypothetical protein
MLLTHACLCLCAEPHPVRADANAALVLRGQLLLFRKALDSCKTRAAA